MPDSTPTAETFAQLIEAMDERATFCGCPGEIPTVDRMCVRCKRPNLRAMIEWRANGCTCRRPNDSFKGIKLRSCRTCERPVFRS